jgi:hypothetical protein
VAARTLRLAAALLALLLFTTSSARAGRRLNITVVAPTSHDFLAVLKESGCRVRREDSVDRALLAAPSGSAVMLLTPGYPDQRTPLPPGLLGRAAEKDLRLYVEYPADHPGVSSGSPVMLEWERAVVAAERIGPALPRLRILSLSGGPLSPLAGGEPLLVAARVAGFDTAVFGLPPRTLPLLVRYPDRRLLVAASALSRFRVARFAPAADWARVWEQILTELDPTAAPIQLRFRAAVRPAFGETERLPRDSERAAVRRGVDWYRRSGLLLTEERQRHAQAQLAAGKNEILPPRPNATGGDGGHGILEGLASAIQPDGSQNHLAGLRADCNAEAAMAFALAGGLLEREADRRTARALLEFTFTRMTQGPRGNPRHPAYGLIAWGVGSPAWEVANYGDDNARTILAALVASASLRTDQWDAHLLRALLANLRTTGRLGFRGDRIDIPDLERNGWKHYEAAAPVNHAPNFEAYLWACNLWAYERTGHTPFLEKARTAIGLSMDAYPTGWRWRDSLERARMLLPLAWLARVEDTPRHRAWLRRVADDLLATMQPSGAIRERFGGGGGHLQAPASNESYGSGEAPLAQRDGDPVTDQLYTTGFALLGLREAAAATGDADLRRAEDLLAGYLCRIQVRSERHPFVDGAWFRAFDYGRWDYFASAADAGWGPWNAETGWGLAWINAVLALRQLKTNVWDLTGGSRIAAQWESIQAEMARNAGGPWRP